MKALPAILNWLLATGFVFFQFGLQLAASVFNHQWAIDFSLDHVQVSLLSSMFFVTYLLMQLPVGMIYSRYPIKPIMGCAALLLGVACYWLAITDSYTQALLARALMGFASSFAFIGMVYVSGHWFHVRRFTLMLALSETVSMLSLMVVVPAMSYLMHFFRWQSMLEVAAGLLALLAVLIFVYVGDRSSQIRRKRQRKCHGPQVLRDIPKLLSVDQLWWASLYGFLAFSVVCAFTSLWGVSFIQHTTTLSRPIAAQISAMVLLGTAIGGPLSSIVVNYLGACKNTMLISSLLSGLIMTIVVFVPDLPTWSLYISYTLIGITCSSYLHTFNLV